MENKKVTNEKSEKLETCVKSKEKQPHVTFLLGEFLTQEKLVLTL